MALIRNRFNAGSGVYKCQWCGKMTRETGDGESDAQLCAKCNYEGLMENPILDGEQHCTCGNTSDFEILFPERHLRCNICGATGCYENWKPVGTPNKRTYH